MGVRTAIGVVALVAAFLPARSYAQVMSADAIIAACQARAKLTDQWNPLQAERDQLAQTLRNYGFDNTVAQQEALGNRADDILRDNGVNARQDFMDKTASEAATAMQGFLKNLETIGRPLNDAERGQLQNLARRLPARAREAVMRLAQEPRTPIAGSALWGAALEQVGMAASLYSIATAETAKEQAWQGIMAAAGTVNPAFGLVLANVDYAVNNLWQVGQLMWTDQQIKALTNATEADLRSMKNATDRMKVVGKQLANIRSQLGALPPCDSTQLVRSPQSSTPPDIPNVPTPPAENTGGNGGNAAASSGGGGVGAGTVAGITAAAVGGGVGLYALNEYQKKLACNQYETQIQSDLNTFQTAANNAAACRTESCFNQRIPLMNNAISAMLATAGEWCTCLGPNASAEISAADRAAVRGALNDLRSFGITSGTLPSCFR